MSSHHARVPVPGTAAPAPGAPQTATPAAPEALRPAAATLTVGAADDRAEHAADALADRALARLDGADPHRHTAGCGHLRRSADAGGTGVVGLAGGALDADVTSRVDAARSGGTGLPGGVRRRMESAFGTDLGHVRVHTGPEAGQLSRAMSAEAFTTGDDIFFGSGRFAPHDPVGEKVLAHEIAHVVQETGSRAVRRWPNILKKIFGSSSSEPSEKDKEKQQVAENKAAEPGELAARAADRAAGEQGRAQLQAGLVVGDGVSEEKRDANMKALWARQEEAIAFELQTYKNLMDAPGASHEKAVDEAYRATWDGKDAKYADMVAVKPERATVADRLMRQVGHAQDVEKTHVDVVAAEDQQLTDARIMPVEVEAVYDRMVSAVRDIRKNDDKLHPEVARAKAAKDVRASLTPKLAGMLPVRNTPIDREAWERAEARAPIMDARRARQAEGLAANLSALDQLDAKVESGTSAAGGGLSAAGSAGGAVAGRFAQEPEKAPGSADRGPAADAPPTSDGGKAKEGIGSVTDILKGLLTAVREAFATATAVRDAWKEKDPYAAMKATKSGASSVDGLVSSAKSTANLAKLIDPGVVSSVAKVVPGLDIAASALSMVKAVTDVAVAGMRQRETDTALFKARTEPEGKSANVMVWPLMNVSRSHTKNLESTTWALGSSVADLGLSIAGVVTLGVSKVADVAKSVVDKVHDLGHFIADEVFVAQAQTADREYSLLHLEGGSENMLRRHPKAAVDGIVLRAAGGDATAERFLANYRVHGRPVDRTLLDRIKPKQVVPVSTGPQKSDPRALPEERTTDDGALALIREAVLESMGVGADPQSVFERTTSAFKKVVDGVTGSGKGGLLDRWRRTEKLAGDRNSVKAGDEKSGGKVREDRGFFWRVQETLKGEEHLATKERMTKVLASVGTKAPVAGLVVGKHTLAPNATPPDFAKFVDAISVKDIEQELAGKPQRNSPEMVDVLLELLQRKVTEAAA